MRALIGLCGEAGSGKDYIFWRLASLFPNSERVAFADVLKFDIEETLGVTPYALSALRSKPYSPEVRSLLQWWGTELRRDQDADYWLKASKPWLTQALATHDLVVITDVRYANEADLIRSLGGLVVRVWATEEARRRRLGGAIPAGHASEVIDFDYDAAVSSAEEDRVFADTALVLALGLEASCFKCVRLEAHPTHDSGKPSGLEWDNRGTGRP